MFIRDEILEQPGLSVSDAADATDVRGATRSDPVNGKVVLSPEMASRIEKVFAVNTNDRND